MNKMMILPSDKSRSKSKMTAEKQTGTWQAFGLNPPMMSLAVQASETLHSRLDELEKEFVELRNRVTRIKPVKKD